MKTDTEAQTESETLDDTRQFRPRLDIFYLIKLTPRTLEFVILRTLPNLVGVKTETKVVGTETYSRISL